MLLSHPWETKRFVVLAFLRIWSTCSICSKPISYGDQVSGGICAKGCASASSPLARPVHWTLASLFIHIESDWWVYDWPPSLYCCMVYAYVCAQGAKYFCWLEGLFPHQQMIISRTASSIVENLIANFPAKKVLAEAYFWNAQARSVLSVINRIAAYLFYFLVGMLFSAWTWLQYSKCKARHGIMGSQSQPIPKNFI